MGLLQGSAFITGAASAFAFALHGITKIALLDYNEENLHKTAASIKEKYPHVQVLPLMGDVSIPGDITAALSKVASQFGRLDVAVNNAGVAQPRDTPLGLSDERWDKVMSINAGGVFRCQRGELEIMLKQEDLGMKRGRGSIINVSSLYGIVGPLPNITGMDDYVASKHAIMGMTKVAAQFSGPHNVRVNAICPGYVKTPLLGQAQGLGDPGHWLHDHVAHTPLGRLAEAEEIADAIVFLASSLSSFVTGTGLVVDGGFTTS